MNFIDQHIEEKGYNVQSGKLYLFWNHRGWLKKNGDFCASIEESVDLYVKMFPTKKKGGKKSKKSRRIKKHFKCHKIEISYDEQLHDIRWYRFRKEVLNLKGNKCMICGCGKYIQIHHPKYESGKYAWEYDPNKMMVLCDKCHKTIHGK